MSIKPILADTKINESLKTNSKNPTIEIDFSDVLSNAKIKALTPSEAEDIGFNGILSQINNEPPEDREEDLRLFSQFKHTGYVFFPPSLKEQKKKIPCFPPATVPGHIRAKFNDFFNQLNISSDKKDFITFCLRNGYQEYCKENPNNTLDTYNKDNLKSVISYVTKYIQHNKDYIEQGCTDDNSKNSNTNICQSIKDVFDKFLKYLKD